MDGDPNNPHEYIPGENYYVNAVHQLHRLVKTHTDSDYIADMKINRPESFAQQQLNFKNALESYTGDPGGEEKFLQTYGYIGEKLDVWQGNGKGGLKGFLGGLFRGR